MLGKQHSNPRKRTDMQIRALTEKGVQQFRAWLENAKAGAATAPPTELLTDTDTSEPLHGAGEVELRQFTNRYELGVYVDQRLAQIPITVLPYTHGVWSWLSLFFIDVLAQPRTDGTRMLNELVRYIPTTEYTKYYRNLIGFAVHAIRDLGPEAEPLLVSTKPGILHTDYCEQIFGYQDLCQTRGFISVANALYFDPNERKIKKGATPNKRRAGTLRRLGDIFYQLELTYDVQGMDWPNLNGLLPSEFNPWKEAA